MKFSASFIIFISCLFSVNTFAQFDKLIKKTKSITTTNKTNTTNTTTGTTNNNSNSNSNTNSTTNTNATFRSGDRVEVNYKNEWRKATINQISSAGRPQVQLDEGGPTMWVEANTVRAINEPNRDDEKTARMAKRPFKEGDLVEWIGKDELLAFGKVTGVPNETQINVYEEGNSPYVFNNTDVKPSTPSTGKYKVGERIAVIESNNYEMATISEVTPGGYDLSNGHINVNKMWHEKNIYRFDEAQFIETTKPIEELLQKLEFAYNEKQGYLQFTGKEAKEAITKLDLARAKLQPQKLNLPYTHASEWKKSPNFTLYLLQQSRNLIYMDVCSNDTTITASDLLKINLENATTDAVLEKDEHGLYPKDFSKYFVSTKGYENFMAEYKTWATNREDVLAVLGKSEKNDWSSVKPVFEKKNAEYMAKLAEYSKTYDLNIAGHNPTWEAMAKKTLQAQYPNLVILKSWLTRTDFIVRKDIYNIPTTKFMFVQFLCTSPDYKTQICTSVCVAADYSGGKYGALYTEPASKEQYWGRIGDFILNK